MRHLDLFTGIGGFTIAAESVGFETVAFSEIHKDKCIVLKHYWPHVPNLGDICDERFLERANEVGPFDLVTGGVPCQPSSALGQMRGAADERWLWPEFVRVVRTFRPRVAVAENPPSVLVLPEFHRIIGEIAALGYDLFWDVIPAAAFGAGHLRERVFIVAADAQSKCKRNENLLSNAKSGGSSPRSLSTIGGYRQTSADAHDPRLQGHAGDVVRDGGKQQGRSVAAAGVQDAIADTDSIRSQAGIGKAATEHIGRKKSRMGINRKIEAPDLRGRVIGPDWWHEAHTGIPVLAPGISGRLAEAVSLCIGDSVVPQVAAAVLQPIYEMLSQ